jgi:hypothetical protein
LPHLVESLRLHVELKTLTNLADCEEHVGQLVAAQEHWVQARDRAGVEGNEKVRDAAASKLVALEKRMPRLILKLAPGSPSAVEVIRDGTALGAISLGLPLPTDPGDHVLVLRAQGHADATTHVALAEAQEQEVVLTVGPVNPEAWVPLVPKAGDGGSPASGVSEHKGLGTQRVLAITAASAGGAGLVLGTIFGVAALTSWGSAESECGSGCLPNAPAQTERSHALTYATVSTVGFVAGGILAAGGVALWLTAPSSKEGGPPTGSSPVSGVAVVPGLGGLILRGAF